jgi:hypothetical protein
VNDPTAIGAMKIVKKHGYKIPGDVALVGFTELKLAESIDPPLTSLAQPTKEIGRIAAQLLLEQIEPKGIFVSQTVVLNRQLNVRESSLKLKSINRALPFRDAIVYESRMLFKLLPFCRKQKSHCKYLIYSG